MKNRLFLALGIFLASSLSTRAQTAPIRLNLSSERAHPAAMFSASQAAAPVGLPPPEPFAPTLTLDPPLSQQPGRFVFLLDAIHNRDHKLERLFQADVVKTPWVRQTRIPVFELWDGRLQIGAFVNTRNYDNTLFGPLCPAHFGQIGGPRLRGTANRGLNLTFRLDPGARSISSANSWRCIAWLLGASPACPR